MRKKRHASRFRWDGPPSERERGEETSVSTSEHGGFSLALEVKRAERVWEERVCVCVCDAGSWKSRGLQNKQAACLRLPCDVTTGQTRDEGRREKGAERERERRPSG